MLQNQNGYVMIFPSLLFASVSAVASSAAFQQTKLQRRIWRVSLLQQGTCAYFISVALSSEWVLNNALHSALDVPVFKWPWEASDVRGVSEGNVISIQSQSGSGWKKASVLQLWSNQISFIITTVTVARCETIKHRKRKDLSELKAVAHNGNLYNSWVFFHLWVTTTMWWMDHSGSVLRLTLVTTPTDLTSLWYSNTFPLFATKKIPLSKWNQLQLREQMRSEFKPHEFRRCSLT